MCACSWCRAGRGVDLNQLKLYWITSEAQRLKRRVFRIDIDFKNAFNSMSQSLLWAVLRAHPRMWISWSNMRLNIGKTVVVDIDGGSGELYPTQLTYKNQPVKGFQANESCRHLGFWATPNGDVTVTKQRVLTKTEEVLGILTHHPLESNIAKELFRSMTVSVFRFSAAQVRWSQTELDKLQSLWVEAYKRAQHLAASTATDILVFLKKLGGKELSTPVNIIAQELCNNIRRCLVHEDVAKSITMQELQRAKDEWMCSTLDDLYDEMELWTWTEVQHNRWARAMKASNQVGVPPMWLVDEQEDEKKQLSWATATRPLRRLKARIVRVDRAARESTPRSKLGF